MNSFHAGPIFQQCCNCSLKTARSLSSNSPSLTFFYAARERGKPISRTPLFPASFGWLVGAGVYAGNVDAHFADDTVTVDCELVSFGTDVSQLGGFVLVLG